MTIDRYVITGLVGVGDITRVYAAHDPLDGRAVALKVLREDSPVADAPRYFAQEVALLRQFDHPHIPTFYEAGGGDQPYMAHELIRGADLQARLDAGAGCLPEADVVGWALQLCDALVYLQTHPAGPVVFRDLKPAHIMVSDAGKATLIDFNLAVRLPPGALWITGEKLGTQGFAAPEQYEGLAGVASDVYTLGATLHTLLTGCDPRQPLPFTFAPPRTLNPALSDGITAVITRALAHDPADRFPTVAVLRAALAACR